MKIIKTFSLWPDTTNVGLTYGSKILGVLSGHDCPALLAEVDTSGITRDVAVLRLVEGSPVPDGCKYITTLNQIHYYYI